MSTSVKLVRYDSPVCYILRRLNLLEGWLRALLVDFARAKLVGVGHATEVKDAMLCGGLRARGTMEEGPQPWSDDWAEKIESAEIESQKTLKKLFTNKKASSVTDWWAFFDPELTQSCSLGDLHLSSHGPNRTKQPQEPSRPTQARSESSPVATCFFELTENEGAEDWVARA